MRKDNMKKFIQYACYAFGIPIIIVTIVFIVNEYELIPDYYNNRFGNLSCFISDSLSGQEDDHSIHARTLQLIYIYVPIFFFIIVNVCFYSVTAYKIYRVQKETSICRKGENSRHTKNETAR